MAATPSLESIAAAVGLIQKDYVSGKSVGWLWFFAISALVLIIVAYITLFASVFPVNVKALNAGSLTVSGNANAGSLNVSNTATVNALNVGPTKNVSGPASQPGDIVVGGNVYVGTADAGATATSTGAVLVGANVNAEQIYASGGKNSTAVSKFYGATVITNGVMAGGVTPYTGTNPAANFSM